MQMSGGADPRYEWNSITSVCFYTRWVEEEGRWKETASQRGREEIKLEELDGKGGGQGGRGGGILSSVGNVIFTMDKAGVWSS